MDRKEKARAVDCRNYLEPSKGGMYCCPFCGSGTGNNKSGAVKYYEAKNNCFCHACHKPFDAVDLHMEKYGVGFQTAVEDMAGGNTSRSIPKKILPKAKKAGKEASPELDFLEYFSNCWNNLSEYPEAVAYLESRGISVETAGNLFVGFDPKADPANYPGGMTGELCFPCPRIIIPCGEHSYQGRAIIKTDYPKMGTPGTLGLFNYDAAMAKDDPNIFITEGGFDALSVEEVGGVAIAVNGVGNAISKLLPMLKADERTPEKKIILCLDADEAGQNKQAELVELLREAYIPFVVADISCGKKDPNEALVADRVAFSDAVAAAKEQIPTIEESEREFVKPKGDYSDGGNAEAFLPYIKGRLIYTHEYGWLSWDGMRWTPDRDTALNFANDWTKMMLSDAKNQYSDIAKRQEEASSDGGGGVTEEMKIEGRDAKEYYAHAKKSRSTRSMKSFLELAAARCSVPPDSIDCDPYILNTPCGMYDLRTGHKILLDPSKLCTKITATEPGSEGAEMWQDFLATVTDGDKELINYLHYLCGAVALGEVTDQVIGIFFCYSEHGSTGKSTFWNTVAAALGDYAISFQVTLFTNASLYQPPKFTLPRLKGARLVLLSELPEKAVLSNGNLKAFASVDNISGAENKGKPPFEFKPSGTYIGYSNHLPTVNETDTGTWRRLHILPFNHVFREDADPDFPDILREKASPAILQWLIDGAAMFVKAGKKLPKCRAVDEAGKTYRTREDQLGRFIEDCLELAVGTGVNISTSQMYNKYKLWTGTAGEKSVLSRRQFTSAMKRKGFATQSNSKEDYFNQFYQKEIEYT